MHYVGTERVRNCDCISLTPFRNEEKEKDPYEELGYAIVLQAVIDWLDGQKKIQKRFNVNNLQELRNKFPDRQELAKRITPKIRNMMDAESFFKSEYCEDLCDIDGRVILARLKSGKITRPGRFVIRHNDSRKIQIS